ncbi:MAG TPA: phosphohydrolase, partial [Clostridiales bacterium]|nr:phosphohydrolase [Clostridiales bacterium]
VADVKTSEEIKSLIQQGDLQLKLRGYTEHNLRHVTVVAENAGNILTILGYDERQVELAKIAGFMHDIGNAVNRQDHENSGAILAYTILTRMKMNISEAAQIMSAIGNHDETYGAPVSNISAALILADKSDVHRSRVRNQDPASFDIHDRVNYAVYKSSIDVSDQKATLELDIDPQISPVMDYFEIFLGRMSLCRRAAEFLKLDFNLVINENRLL